MVTDGQQARSSAHGGPAQAGDPHGFTRRQALQRGAAIALGATVFSRPAAARAATAGAPLVAAMHVHASSSEGPGSWEQQYANCVTTGVDVLWQTDHDFRARALNYMTTVTGSFVPSTTGSWKQHAATLASDGSIHVLVESSSSTGTATQTLAMADKPTAVNSFRTGIDGQTFVVAFGTSRLDAGTRFDLVVPLSVHPAQSGRPAGQYSLRYRFLPGGAPGRFTSGGGLVGVVTAPMPANGVSLTLTPRDDIAALWPTMAATDHCSFSLAFVVTSPHVGEVADVRLRSVTVQRVRHDAAGVRSVQQALRQAYSARSGVAGFVSEEVSLGPQVIPHCNAFGYPAEFALKDGVTTTNWPSYYAAYIQRVHGSGGVVSWNHPFGFTSGPVLAPADQVTKRRQTFAALQSDDLLGADILEVGYTLRGYMPFHQHLDLWDTFSRQGRWLTGNGVNDDHSGSDWRSLSNGFLTGLWSASAAEADLATALAGGRAYVFHPGRTPGLWIDTLVDGAVPMGAVSVRSVASRTVAISVANLPSDCTLELRTGPVDRTGQDPLTTSVRRWTASAVGSGGTGTVSAPVSTSSACFVRAQVLRNGKAVATGNPTWLLRTQPPGAIPAARVA